MYKKGKQSAALMVVENQGRYCAKKDSSEIFNINDKSL